MSGYVISGPHTTGITLSDPVKQNPATVASGAYITNPTAAGDREAIYGTVAAAWALSNYGTISAAGTSVEGIALAAGGTVRNATSGFIYGYDRAIAMYGAAGSVVNRGTIAAGNTAAFEAIHLFAGGYVGNTASTALIAGQASGIYIGGGAGTLDNLGRIEGLGATGIGVDLAGGGSVVNGATGVAAAVISGGGGVVVAGGAGSVANYGTIAGTTAGGVGPGVALEGGGTLTNSGLISAYGALAVLTGGAAASVVNSGTIVSSPGGGYIYFAVFLSAGGGLTNAPGGLIEGYPGAVAIQGTPATLANLGIIEAAGSGSPGVYLATGGFVGNGASASTGAQIVGYGAGVQIAGGGGSVVNYGTIAGTGAGADGIDLFAGGVVANRGLLLGNGDVVEIDQGGTLTNRGTIAGATARYGVCLREGGYLENGAIGLPSALISVYGNAVEVQTNPGSVANYGTLLSTGVGGAGAALQAGGTLTNSGVIIATGASYTTGVYLAAAGVVGNVGTIDATAGIALRFTQGGTVVNAVIGVVLAAVDAVVVEGAPGGIIANHGTIAGGRDGIVLKSGGVVLNVGTVSGAASYGVYLTAGGTVQNLAGGVLEGRYAGLLVGSAAGGTVINSGTIAGSGTSAIGVNFVASGSTLQNAGTVVGGGGVAVELSGGGDVVVVEPGAVFGGVIAGFAASDTLDMAGVVANGATYSGGVLTLTNGGVVAATLSLSTVISNPVFTPTPDGSGGTLVEASPAGTGMIFSGTYFSGIVLSNPTTQNPSTVTASGYVTNSGNGTGVSGGAYAWNFSNFGTITTPGSHSAGVYFEEGGSVTNGAAGSTAALIESAGYHGVRINGAAGAVTNFGTIEDTGAHGDGVFLEAGGSVGNFGTIAATGSAGYGAVALSGDGSVSNGQSGAGAALIEGYGRGVAISGAGAVANYGTIAGTGPNGIGVYLRSGGSVTNGTSAATGGLITGTMIGVKIAEAAGTAANYGAISGTGTGGDGVLIVGAGQLANAPSATISGYATGAWLEGGGTAANDGLIVGTGTGGDGVVVGTTSAGVGLVVNDGTITGANLGVWLADGGDARNYGVIAGNTGIAVTGGLGTVGNYGTVLGGAFSGVYLQAGGSVVSEGTILSTGSKPGILINGFAGSVANYGVVAGSGTSAIGVWLQAGGSVVNDGALDGGADGVVIQGGAGTVVNAGAIAATDSATGAGIALESGGYVGNSTGGTISGFNNGVLLQGAAAATVVNHGTIASTGSNGSAVSIGPAGGLVVNGTAGSTLGLISGYHLGIGFFPGTAAALTVVNYGAIRSTQPGTAAGTGFNGFAVQLGVSAVGDITNFGTLAAAQTNGGAAVLLQGSSGTVVNETNALIASAGGNAVSVTGATATVTNFGTMANFTGAHTTVYFADSGYLTNAGLGLIANGAGNAVSIHSGFGTVDNSGTIAGFGALNHGVYLGGGGVVTNAGGGLIDGLWAGVDLQNVAGTVSNLGTIESTATFSQPGGSGTLVGVAVILEQGGLVINGARGATAGLISGYALGVYTGGGDGVPNAGAVGTVINYGTIASIGTNGVAAPAVDLSSGGTVTNYGALESVASSAVDNKGTIAATINNFGVIENFTTAHAAVYSRSGGIVTNAVGALIASERTAISFNDTVGTTVSFGTVVNAGTIVSNTPAGATAGSGVYFGEGGSLINQADGLISADRSGVSAHNAAATVSNQGTIVNSGSGFSGVYLGAGGNVANSGLISGGYGISIAGTTGAAAAVTNIGTITGGAGIAISATGTASNTIVNYGTVIGTGGVAIGLGGGSDAVVLEPGSQLSGAIGNFHPGDTIDLPGISANGISYAGGVVTLTNGTTVDQLNVTTPLASPQFTETRDATGGSEITVSSAPPPNYLFITGFAKTNLIQTGLIKEFPSGFVTGNQGLTTPFDVTDDASGNNFSEISTSLTINVSIPDATNVFTLMNAYGPPDGVDGATVEFVGSLGTTQTFTLVYGTDVRDFYQGVYANTINGTTTQNAFTVSGVTDAAATGDVTTGEFGTYNVDEQDFVLDPAFAGQTLDQIIITNLDASATPILLGMTAETVNGSAIVVSAGVPFIVSSGQILSDIIVLSGGVLDVEAGATVIDVQVGAGGIETVGAGGLDISATVASGGFQDVFGTASATMIVAGGSQTVEAGGVADNTVLDDAAVQTVSGTTSGTVVSAGDTQVVDGGGTANATTVSNGGTQIVSSGGAASGSIVYSGGVEIVSAGGVDAGAALSGGLQQDFGAADGVAIGSGGRQIVEAGGTESGTVIGAGGTLELAAGAVENGGILFSGAGGVLQIDDTTMPTVPIGGIVRGDAIDLRTLPFSTSDTVGFDPTGGTLTVSAGVTSDSLTLSGVVLSGAVFALFADPQSGTLVREVPPPPTGLTLGTDTGVQGDDRTDTPEPLITGLGFAAGDTVTLFDGVAAVGSGTVNGSDAWSVFTGFLANGSHSLTAVETDSFGDVGGLSAPLVITIDTTPPTTQAVVLAVGANSAATPIGIAAPSDPDDPASALTIAVAGLPSDGTVTLGDDVTDVTVGEQLTVAQLMGLEFTPTANASGQTSTFTYSVTDPAGNLATGTAFLGIDAIAPPGAPSLINGLGGPEGFGPNELPSNDDGSSGAINITSVFGPAGIDFFGQFYTSLYINNNGNITFNGPLSSFTPGPITAGAGNPIIAPFWADVDTRGGPGVPTGGNATGSDAVWYDLDTVNHIFTVTWDDVGYYGEHTNELDAFQLQLIDEGNGNFDIVFRYQSINWTTGDASGGVDGLGGVVANAGFSAGNGVNAYELPQSGDQAAMLGLPSNTAPAGTEGATAQPGVYEFQVVNGVVVPPPPSGLALSPGSDSGVVGDDITDVTTPVITGSGVSGDSLTLFDGSMQVGSGTVGADGTWSVQVDTVLAFGVHSLTATEADSTGDVSFPSAALSLTITSPAQLFGFIFTYGDGRDYYLGTVADDGSFHYSVGESFSFGLGQYQILSNLGPIGEASGTVSVTDYSHAGPGLASVTPVDTAAGLSDGINGLGSESDVVLETDGATQAFGPTVEVPFPTTLLFGFVYTYANGAFYTGTVADNGSFGVTAGSRTITDGAGNFVGSYTLYADGTTALAAGTVVVDRVTIDGQAFVPDQTIAGSGGLGSEAGSITVNGRTVAFSDQVAPAVQVTIQTAPSTPPPDTGDVIANEVNQIFADVLGRNPSPNELATYSTMLAGGASPTSVRQILAQSAEGQGDLNQLFVQIFNQPIDQSDAAAYTTQIIDGSSLAAVQLILAQSLQAQADLGQIFEQVLNRPIDGFSLITYMGALADGGSLATVRQTLAFGAEAQSDLNLMFSTAFGRTPSAAELAGMEDQLANGATQSALQSALASSGSAGGYSIVNPPTGSAGLTAAPGTPTLFAFDGVGFGNDTIGGFDPTIDTIELPQTFAANFAGLQTLFSADSGGTLISLGAGQSILIEGVAPGNLGAANFLLGPPPAAAPITALPSALPADDFAGTGTSNVLWRNDAGSLTLWTLDGPTIGAAPALTYQGNVPAPDSSWSVAGVGDFTGDGMADILWRSSGDGLSIWTMVGAQVAAEQTPTYQGAAITPDSSWSVAGIGDFTGDGMSDILWQSGDGDLDLWEMNGSSVAVNAPVGYADPSVWSLKGIGDFNGNGKSDILWQDTSGNVDVWEMDGTNILASGLVGYADPASWHIDGIGDFTGDGKSDILWQDTSGDLTMWEMNGLSVASSAMVGFVDPTTWQIAGIGDYNGDGKSDILWRNTSNDALSLWTMNGSVVTASQSPTYQGNPVAPGGTWQPVG
jgi:hypothetical protein